MRDGTKCARLSKLGTCFLLVAAMAVGAFASNYPNTITFSNLSGDDALVKLIGPVRANVGVSNGTQASVKVPAGTYYFLVRYCSGNGRCSYAKGDPFDVVQTSTRYSVISITLHQVL